MAWGSFERIIHPVAIAFNNAIFVAIIGLIVNGASIFILGHKEEHPEHPHGHGHEHEHESENHHHGHHHDHNLKSAYYHVLADALTSILAIIALLAANILLPINKLRILS